jgi:hypothetical protein
MEACGMTEREQSAERGKAERRELEAAGWESKGRGAKGRGAKAVWKSPTDGHWYVHHQAVIALRKARREAT